jgi:hypothetical protein
VTPPAEDDPGPLPPKGPPPTEPEPGAPEPPPAGAAPEPPPAGAAPPPAEPPPAGPEPPATAEPPPREEPPPCVYPAAGDAIHAGGVMPALSWTGAYAADGGRVDLDLRDVHCAGRHRALVFVVGAGWCPTCPPYERAVAAQARDIERAGGLLVFVETEDRRYRPSTHDSAEADLRDVIRDAPSIRVGDGETRPRASLVRDSPIVGSYPSAFVVRTRDMRVVARQDASRPVLSFAGIVADPDAAAGGCGPEAEEPTEPNDRPEQAGLLRPGTVAAGVCDARSDFWRVDLPGAWRLDLDFRHAAGDIDVFVWDPARNAPLRDAGGRPVGSDSGDDGESFTHRGPAVIRVFGYEQAMAPYRITLTAL